MGDSPRPVVPCASVRVMHWPDELLVLALSHSAMVPNTQRAPPAVCRQNGALPLWAVAN